VALQESEMAMNSYSAVEAAPAATGYVLPPLPYAEHSLEPVISVRTVALHHGKHHRAYVDNLNRLVAGTSFAGMSLERLIRETAGSPGNAQLFNNAAQAWNHAFHWRGLRPWSNRMVPQGLATSIDASFGRLHALKSELAAAAADD
jgi:superoxide dismutase, Fe-Mn family